MYRAFLGERRPPRPTRRRPHLTQPSARALLPDLPSGSARGVRAPAHAEAPRVSALPVGAWGLVSLTDRSSRSP